MSSPFITKPEQSLAEKPFVPKLAKAFRQLFYNVQAQSSYAVLLESAGGPEALNRKSILAFWPTEVITLKGNHLVYECLDQKGHRVESAEKLCLNWQDLEAFLEKQLLKEPLESPSALNEKKWTNAWFGVLGYGFYRYCFEKEFEDIPNLESPLSKAFPDLCLVRFAQGGVLDTQTGQIEVWGASIPVEQELSDLWEKISRDVQLNALRSEDSSSSLNTAFTCSFSQEAFEEKVSEVLEYIGRGDLYQANLTMRFSAQKQIAPLQVYEALSQNNPSPFCGLLKTPQHVLLCNSPERLIEQDEIGKLQTRPIAGTRGRGKTQLEDNALGETLLKDEKERAEHLMLVDLLRNDVGRVSAPGTVSVDELLTLERYSHVTHLVSNIIGQRKSTQSSWDVIRSLFPGGTITGCPKMRCIEILNALEPVGRGWYTGSLGYLNPTTGVMDWNILIRSLFLTPLKDDESQEQTDCINRPDLKRSSLYNVDIHVGAGIVADSVPELEYKECLRKAQASFSALLQDQKLTNSKA